ncbi:MAG: glycoside hydrolase family 2 protein [Planctomycetota bacterium]
MQTRVLVLILLAFAHAWALPSQSLSLDGSWQLCRAASAERPDGKWQPVTVPSFVSQVNDKPFLWYRRNLTVPQAMAGRHLFLRFQGVKFVTTVFVNGGKVGGHFGGWEPFEIDVTKACRQGENDLLVRVQDVTGVIDQAMDYAKQGRGIRFIAQAKDSIMAPVGSQYTRVGIWQSASLVTRPDVYVAGIRVRTSVRKKQIAADVTVRNLRDAPVRVDVVAQVDEADLSLGTTSARVRANGSTTVTLERGWEKPRLWSLDQPHLYRLTAGAAVSRKQIDYRTVRFGFREFWIDGTDFVLNGVPMKFLATAGHPRGQIGEGLGKEAAIDFYRRIREAGCVAMRLHANVWPKAWFEAADEVGMPLIMESAFFCYSRSYALTQDAFWDNYHDHLRAIVRDHQNHPSVVMISLENEILHCGGAQCAKDCEPRLAEAGRLVKKLDPTRPIMFDGDADPEGVADVVNLHYPLDFNTQNLWPDVGYWVDKGMVVRGWPRRFWKWDRRKPLYFGEFLHLQHYREPDPFTTLLGDGAYLGYNLAMARCKARAWEMQIKAYRAQDVSGMCPWTLTETGPFPSPDNPRYLAVERAYRPIAAFIRERHTRFYEGETVKRTVDLYNDTPRPAKLTVEWELRDDDKVVDSGRRQFDTRPAQRIPFAIELKMPDAAAPWLDLSLALRIRRGGRVVFQDAEPYRAFPRTTLGGLLSPLCGLPTRGRIALF